MNQIYLLCMTLFTIIFSIWDMNTNKHYKNIWKRVDIHHKNKIRFFLFFHNIIYFYLYFTIFFVLSSFYYRNINTFQYRFIVVYFLYSLFTIIHWIINNNRCELTLIQNRLLQISSDNGFRDPYTIIYNKYPIIVNGSLRGQIYYSAVIINILLSLLIILK